MADENIDTPETANKSNEEKPPWRTKYKEN
jgi:hypothetical protein